MKSSLILLAGLGLGIACTVIYFNRQKTSPAPALAPVVESVAVPVPAQPEVVVTPKSVSPAAAIVPETTPVAPTNAIPENPETEAAAAFRKTIDALLSPQLAGKQKQEMFDRFRTSGQLDQVIAELKRRATENPTDPGIPTTLGEAMLNKVRLLHEAGADVNEVGILAMQADLNFSAALKLDPANWEAQFVKYSTMFYWPPDAKRDNETAQKLSSLIDQQEALPQQPHFAQTYVALGNQYQKIGKSDFAEATWRLGLTKFPTDPTLLQKLAPK